MTGTSDEIALAFAPPEARARATTGHDLPDRISLRDHVVEVEIGAFQSERGATQRVRFGIVVELAERGAGQGDDVDRILSYDVLTDAIAAELAAERLNLLEALAERIAARILLAPQAGRVFVRIEKLDRGPFALGVEIARGRSDPLPLAEAQGGSDRPLPCVAYLPPDADTADLPALVDRLMAQGEPLVICTGAAPEARPEPAASGGEAARRIGLLAIEQAAWRLAAGDPRLTVTATRTELDWHIARGLPCIWAPSKLVLDAVEPPEAGPEDPLGLALWFAGQMQAGELLVLGAAQPRPGAIPLRAFS